MILGVRQKTNLFFRHSSYKQEILNVWKRLEAVFFSFLLLPFCHSLAGLLNAKQNKNNLSVQTSLLFYFGHWDAMPN